MGYLHERWHEACTPADKREIWEWAAQEGALPSVYAVNGRLDIDTCPMIREPMRALRNPMVRRVTVMSGVQCLKTLIGELWLLWLIVNSPGPTQWLHPDDEEGKEHAKERFVPLLEQFPIVHKFFTEARADKTAAFIRFKHMFLRVEGALNKGNLQRKSIQYQMRSEVWQADKWIRGRLKEANSRKTQFVHNSKTYTESQPGWAAEFLVDDMHAEYLDGDQCELQFACEGCRKLQPYLWDYIREDGSRAAMRWDDSERTRRPNGEWRWGELVQTIRYECIHCGHRHHDEPLTRRRMTASQEHVPQNPEVSTHRSFNWNQLAMPNLSWFETEIGGVKNYLLAHQQASLGNEKALMDFWMKVVGQAYSPARHSAVGQIATIELTLEPAQGGAGAGAAEVAAAGPPIEHNNVIYRHRLMAVDVQDDHFWVLVEIWSDQGDSMSLHFEKVYTWADVEGLQLTWLVLHEDVMVDVSHRRHEVKVECSRHGRWIKLKGRERWVCWKALEGSDQETFLWTYKHPKTGKVMRIQLPYSHPPQIGDPCAGMAANDERRKEFKGKSCMVIAWSNPTVKDIVIARRDKKTKGLVDLVRRGPWNRTFNLQMHSQRKAHVQGKFGGSKWKWVKFRDDHGLDCKCMITTRSIQRGLVRPQSGDDPAEDREPAKA